MCDMMSLLDEARECFTAARAAQRRFVNTLYLELKAHGRPLHHTVLLQIMIDRHPSLRPTESRILKALSSAPGVFERVSDGVYQVKRR